MNRSKEHGLGVTLPTGHRLITILIVTNRGVDEMIESVSRRAFSSTSGTYNVRASELARERKLNIFNVTVQFLDDTEQIFSVEVSALFC